MAERLHRLQWVFIRNPVYFITACTYRRQRILDTALIHRCIEEFAQKGPARGAWMGAYVLMPDHIHGFVALTEPMRLGTWVRLLKNAISQQLRSAGAPPPHWQKGFFDHVLRSKESYSQKWDYVRNNPRTRRPGQRMAGVALRRRALQTDAVAALCERLLL